MVVVVDRLSSVVVTLVRDVVVCVLISWSVETERSVLVLI